ncbi:Acyl-CoA dehydrogenase [Planctomycetes bacterium CA13]|uniref:Acyl-CoA dehydrogenase n=1 Tax=Novipirellula herctigrandis TaxID=2527986 RepID=A0A5C5Z860_9BACT|nr:Acyl-CoA dehydrogenase [Planctomycetes bacterium CA13]
MANFFLDNQDIQFLFSHIDMQQLASIQERFAENGDADYAPSDNAEVVDDYRRIMEITGQVAAETLAPNAEQVDRDGNTLNPDGTVTLHPKVRENLDRLAQADLLGFTVPRKYGGLNCPNLIYTMATEVIARADASFMNIFGLQGIAETVNAFASQEIKDEVLPQFAEGEVTGAMVLTEPDAGSDLQSVRLRAHQDENGNWLLNGVKRFITNGCGEILLTLARSEPEMSDGLGLSLFISERCDKIKVRHLEDKLGIHGSPTCELVYEDAPARLIGERKRGLITYVLALMNGARVGIAAQSLGIAEAAFRLARTYAHTRHQFGVPIEQLPAISEMVIDMQVAIEAARAFTYETSRVCDLENNTSRLVEWHADQLDKAELKSLKKELRQIKRTNGMLTPMSKYFCSEMCCRVADNAIQVLGGSGYMKDYAAERHLRDARITTIYEGTSQLQIVAAIRGLTSGVFDGWAEGYEQKEYADPLLSELKQQLMQGRSQLAETIQFAKQKSPAYTELSARRLVDGAITIMTGHLLLDQAANSDRKKRVAKRFIQSQMPILKMNAERVLSGDEMPLEEYSVLAGPVPTNAM